MCGICGFVNLDRRVNGLDLDSLNSMTKILHHRGPDQFDMINFENVGLGFTRLSIIGLENGMQPISNEDDTLVLICNGEIFNYKEIKKDLLSRGHRFKTQTDIEVIIHLYEDFGKDFLNQLNGQFSFAIYDKRKKELFCARDHLGIIPFFYTYSDHTFIFASEIKSILKHPAVKTKPDLTGLDQVFTFAGLISPRTMFDEIYSLENGHHLTVSDNGKIRKEEYWDLQYPKATMKSSQDETFYLDKFKELFERAVEIRLRADVESGLYISGGLDSSMIAAVVNNLKPNDRKKGFSIDFIDSLNSETNYQKEIAASANIDLFQETFLFQDISERLQQSIYHSECPIKETYNTASLSLSETVRREGIKVILTGEGADEFFAGYVGYRFDKMRSLNLFTDDSTLAEGELRHKLWGDKNFFYERSFSEFNQVKSNLYSHELVKSFSEFNCLHHPIINKEKINGISTLNKRAYIDYKLRLVDHLVSDHGDRMAMANSVEARYPFLDKELIDFSTTLPDDLKLRDMTEKYIIKKAAKDLIPASIINREKFHFIAPGSPYLLQNNIEYIDDILSYDLIKRQGYFNPNTIENLKNKYKRPGFKINAPYESDLLISVITFGIFLDTFFK